MRDLFDDLTVNWFESALGKPTPVQYESWPAIAAGKHVLVSAPTGTGKTLSAFLVFIDRLKMLARAGNLKKEIYLIYISPLKSLAGDIRENLRRPLSGVSLEEDRAGLPIGDIAVSIRTGDTTSAERRKMLKSPPHILITTPESLYLLLSSESGRAMLRTAKALVIDELHAMIDAKRGAHLMLSLSRLDRLCEKPLQRIGLSATIKPLNIAAEYLAGSTQNMENVSIVSPQMKKESEIAVISPVADMHILPQGTIWPEIARAVYESCEGSRSAIAFVDGRMYAEKLAFYVNKIAGEGFARTHHGCVSKEQRLQAEKDLRNGALRLLCATSSMELGIDVGDIDRVMQLGYPRSISSVLQRLGRAGHNPGRVSVMYMFPRTAAEGFYCGLTARTAMDGGIENLRPPRLCFDVLAQHLVSMSTEPDGYTVDDVMEILSGAYPFREVSRDDVKKILCMLAGDYEHMKDLPVRPRILYDRIHEKVEGDAYGRMLAVSAGGTIPDTGMFSVKSENGVKLGELDEEFVFEARIGDKFLLGSFAWKISHMNKDTVTVVPSSVEGAQPPFWRHMFMARRLQTGYAFGSLMRKLSDTSEVPAIMNILMSFGLDEAAANNATGFLQRQIEATGVLPDDRTVIIEHFRDDAGDTQMMVHSVFGRQINLPLGMLMREAASRATGMDVNYYDDDDGILLMGRGGYVFPDRLIYSIDPQSVRGILTALLPSTALFTMTFRYNAGRALMMGVRKGKRQPLWIQRLRSAEMLDSVIEFDDHPLIRETLRECLEDYWDLDGVVTILTDIRSGTIKVRELRREEPSPMSLPLRRKAEAEQLYEYSPVTSGVNRVVDEALQEMLKPGAEQLARLSGRSRMPEDEKQLHSLLMIEGDLIAGEISVDFEWFEILAENERAMYIEPGLWIAAEHESEYKSALEDGNFDARMRIARRALRYRGAHTTERLAERYCYSENTALEILSALCKGNEAVESDGVYYHAELYERARHETISFRRKQIKTLPTERYAALLAGRIRLAAPAAEQLEAALKSLADTAYPIQMWESSLLPLRVSSYRPALLDTLLSGGGLFWRITGGDLSFHSYSDIDWEAELSELNPLQPDFGGITGGNTPLEGDEKTIYDALQKRGASFAGGLSGLLSGRPVHEALFPLMEKGLIHADSYMPVRQWLDRDKLEKLSPRRKVGSLVSALTSGRWDLNRPLVPLTVEDRIERGFCKYIILCRETARELGLPWASALEVLRVWEYTGRVRRGYFIDGLSGAQFIRDNEFTSVIAAIENPSEDIIWIPAQDPCQPWGKSLSHLPGRSFICAPGTVVALRAGLPIGVFERQGRMLRVFDPVYLEAALRVFVSDYSKRRIFPTLKRLSVKDYPDDAATGLANAGFSPHMLDFALHQDYL